ncbi:hypothetical protein LPAF129_19710 [Ligilactobacillus pabuli]|uniref:DUF1788 domain-containing protein n=1 Tax=Ligilactobacillus pabuli TaxID=2886039 RepID=A0ABQ5JN90_9LACO|nr:DUF1788 domain-containing protein [Ligilactobacillus pabuli]GKS82285.1 hypothetical protein LPAF129_19710 [Ligilactobacillus pabuli]
MSKINDKFGKLREKMQNNDFQENAGLSNEVGYYVFSYDASQELVVREYIKEMKNDLTIATSGFKIQEFNIFEIMLQIIDQFDYREAFEDMEKEEGIDEVALQINNILEMTENENLIVKYVKERLTDEQTIIFLTGIGQVFPLLRAHTILNTMTQVIDEYPVIMFYPGEYDGLSLKAFAEVADNNYYRAFPI